MDATGVKLLGTLWRVLMIGVAAILLGFAVWLTIGNINVINTHEKAFAEVVSSERTGASSSKGVNFYNVRLRFDLNGKKRNTEISRSTTNYDVGEIIPVYYIEETGYKAIAGDFWGMWFVAILLTFFGLMFLIFGVLPMKKKSQ